MGPMTYLVTGARRTSAQALITQSPILYDILEQLVLRSTTWSKVLR